jgi:cytochrome oxidase Cu insertion factor (SCO1/SenC/PrrC family)
MLAMSFSTGPAQAKGPDEQTSRDYFTDLALVDQEGRRVRFYSDVLKDRVVLISFIYTNCKDACPLIMHRLSQVRDQLGEAFGKRVFFVSVSVDPARDTPQALAKYASQHKAEHPGWVFLTGEKAHVDIDQAGPARGNAGSPLHHVIGGQCRKPPLDKGGTHGFGRGSCGETAGSGA